jgi:hypothetical protein
MGSKAVKSTNFFYFVLFRFVFLVACNWRTLEIREKKGFLDLTVLFVANSKCGCEVLIVVDTDLTVHPMSRHRMIS